MYLWQFRFVEYVRDLYLKKCDLESKVKKYVPGSIAVHKKSSGRVEFYQHTYINGKLHQRYLSKTRDKTLIEELNRKKRELPIINAELKEINKLYKQHLPKALEILKSVKIKPGIYPPTPSENPNHVEWLRFRTNRGEMVRSMSEKIIADTLHKYDINYLYEKRLVINGVEYHPDFTILSPISGTTFYWEHCGINTEDYVSRWHKKLGVFTENGISLGENLIVTTQEDMNDIESVVREWFTMERYRGMP